MSRATINQNASWVLGCGRMGGRGGLGLRTGSGNYRDIWWFGMQSASFQYVQPPIRLVTGGMHAVRQARSFRLIKWKAHMATWPEKLTKPSNNSGLVVSTFGRMPSSVLLDTWKCWTSRRTSCLADTGLLGASCQGAGYHGDLSPLSPFWRDFGDPPRSPRVFDERLQPVLLQFTAHAHECLYLPYLWFLLIV